MVLPFAFSTREVCEPAVCRESGAHFFGGEGCMLKAGDLREILSPRLGK